MPVFALFFEKVTISINRRSYGLVLGKRNPTGDAVGFNFLVTNESSIHWSALILPLNLPKTSPSVAVIPSNQRGNQDVVV